MKIIIATNDEKLYQKIEKNKNWRISFNYISYKEGILEFIETNKNVQYIIIDENLNGQINVKNLINKIKNINSTIKIIFILNKSNTLKEEFLKENKIKYFFKEDNIEEKLFNKIFPPKKIIAFTGNAGSGKTITTIILAKILSQYKKKKVLLIENNIKNNSMQKVFQKKETNKTIFIQNKLYLLRINQFLNYYKKDKDKIINEINKIKNDYDYIFIDLQSIKYLKVYQEIIEETILIMNSNLLEINKIKQYILSQNKEIKFILNNYNENAISPNLMKNIFKNRIKIIGKLKYNKNYNLIINNHFNIKYLDRKTKKEYLNILEKIKELIWN